jgi:NAD(P)-dependent dehydrogenase (short-subunit alcohol dehydrogenase family)
VLQETFTRGKAMTVKKVATVIGVGPGLGAALARRFAADYVVALVARNGEKLIELAREISAAGGTSLAVPADASKEQEIVGAFERIHRELGDTDVLLYNAAMRPVGTLVDTKAKHFREHLAGQQLWRLSRGTAGGARDAQETARSDSVYRGDRRGKTVCDLGGLRAGEVRVARPRPGDGA